MRQIHGKAANSSAEGATSGEFAVIRVGKTSKMAAEVFLSCMVTVDANNGLAYDCYMARKNFLSSFSILLFR